jgi:hypothetical protein
MSYSIYITHIYERKRWSNFRLTRYMILRAVRKTSEELPLLMHGSISSSASRILHDTRELADASNLWRCEREQPWRSRCPLYISSSSLASHRGNASHPTIQLIHGIYDPVTGRRHALPPATPRITPFLMRLQWGGGVDDEAWARSFSSGAALTSELME